MGALAAGLAGVIVGAIVSEALRVWHDYWQRRRRVRGALRLIREELAVALTILEDKELSADDIRRRIATGVISVDQWMQHQGLISETLSQAEWLKLQVPYMGLRLMIAEPDEEDHELVEVAKRVEGLIVVASETLSRGRTS